MAISKHSMALRCLPCSCNAYPCHSVPGACQASSLWLCQSTLVPCNIFVPWLAVLPYPPIHDTSTNALLPKSLFCLALLRSPCKSIWACPVKSVIVSHCSILEGFHNGMPPALGSCRTVQDCRRSGNGLGFVSSMPADSSSTAAGIRDFFCSLLRMPARQYMLSGDV